MMIAAIRRVGYGRIPKIAVTWDSAQVNSQAASFSSVSSRWISSKGGGSKSRDDYEHALAELESKQLYGQAPSLKSISELAHMFRDERLRLKADYQRDYVWKPRRASRLIVTALCNRFVPGIVLNEVKKGTYEVLDGKQRVVTLLAFYLYESDPEMFEKLSDEKGERPLSPILTDLDENYASLNGLSFSDLKEDRQNAFKDFEIPFLKIPFETSRNDVFSCFEDINSGGEDLTAMQLRRVSHAGPYIKALDDMAKNDDFHFIRKPADKRKGKYMLCEKDSDKELILRALAFNRAKGRGFKQPLKYFLNRELEFCEKNADVELDKIKQDFKAVMKISRDVFGEDIAFRKWSGKKADGSSSWSKEIHHRLWDVMFVVFCDLLQRRGVKPTKFIQNRKAITEAVKNLFEQEDLASTLSAPISEKNYDISFRMLYEALAEILKPPEETSRTFKNSPQLRSELYHSQDGKCAICDEMIEESRLDDGNYVHIDHIEPYAKGGTSDKSNAQLTHASCNMSAGAK